MDRGHFLVRLAMGTALAGLLGASIVVTANAAPLVDITVSPQSAGLSGPGSSPYTFDGIRTSDFASINLTSTGGGNFTFTETGYLPVASFDPGNFTPPGLNGTAGASGYMLYAGFTASGTMTTLTPTFLSGAFTNLTLTLYGEPGTAATFDNFSATHQEFCSGCSGASVLGSATLIVDANDSVNIINPNGPAPLPSAFADVLFSTSDGAFFLAPPVPFMLALDSQFSNTPLVTAQYTTSLPAGVSETVTIGNTSGGTGGTGGSGTGQFIANAPEPVSIAILGSGLLGMGLVRRRKRS